MMFLSYPWAEIGDRSAEERGGGAVWLTGSFWPDLIVAALLASLFMKSSVSIASQALREISAAINKPAHLHTES